MSLSRNQTEVCRLGLEQLSARRLRRFCRSRRDVLLTGSIYEPFSGEA